jgi:mycothiol synthase
MLTDYLSTNSNFSLRPATMADCAQVVDLLNACAQVLIGANEFSVELLHSEWTQPGFDLATSSLAAFTTEGRLVGYADLWDMDEPPVKPFAFGRVHPEYEGQGIGTALMVWAEARARQAIDRVPPEVRVALKAATSTRHAPAVQLLQDRSLTPIRYSLEMHTDLPSTPQPAVWPNGVQVTTYAEHGDARAVYRAYQDAWRDHRDSVAHDEEQHFPLWLHRTTADPNYDPSLWFLALDGEEIAGIALSKPLPEEDPELGWIETLAVRRPWRRRGIGSALIHHAFVEFVQRGWRRAGLSVDANSLTGATRLYERAGMHIKGQHVVLEKELRPGVDLSTQSLAE